MPIRKLSDDPSATPNSKICTHPDHGLPLLMVFPPGVYEHTCPRCGAKQVFRVERHELSLQDTPVVCKSLDQSSYTPVICAAVAGHPGCVLPSGHAGPHQDHRGGVWGHQQFVEHEVQLTANCLCRSNPDCGDCPVHNSKGMTRGRA